MQFNLNSFNISDGLAVDQNKNSFHVHFLYSIQKLEIYLSVCYLTVINTVFTGNNFRLQSIKLLTLQFSAIPSGYIYSSKCLYSKYKELTLTLT